MSKSKRMTEEDKARITRRRKNWKYRYWGTHKGKTVDLVHIHYCSAHLTRNGILSTEPKAAVKEIEKFIKHHPHLITHNKTYHPRTIARALIIATLFAIQGDIEMGSPLMTYYIYLILGRDTLRYSYYKRQKLINGMINNYNILGPILEAAMELKKYLDDNSYIVSPVYQGKEIAEHTHNLIKRGTTL